VVTYDAVVAVPVTFPTTFPNRLAVTPAVTIKEPVIEAFPLREPSQSPVTPVNPLPLPEKNDAVTAPETIKEPVIE